MEVSSEVFRKLWAVLTMAKKLAEQMEADKHLKTNPGYLEVKLLKMCNETEQLAKQEYFIHVEVIRQKDADNGFTNALDPPIQGAGWNQEERRWELFTFKEQFFKSLQTLRCSFRFVPQSEGLQLLVLEE